MIHYWDTSALIPCFIQETSTDLVRSWLHDEGDLPRFTSWLTAFEFETVLHRKLKRKLITLTEFEHIRDQWTDFQLGLNFIPLDNRVSRLGIQLQRLYGLLTGDAIQLGSASLLQLEDDQVTFVCLDGNLVKICKNAGLVVLLSS